MAVNVGSIYAVFALRDSFSKQMRAAVSNAEKATKKIALSGNSIRSTGMKISAGIGLPLLGAATAALKFSGDINKAMANVATLIPGNVERVKELKTSVQDLALATGKSTGDISDGLYQVVSAFGDSADTAKILELNVKAAGAGMATTADAIALTSAVTKAYGETTKEGVERAADLAFTTVKLGQTSFPELASAIGKVAISASGLQITQEELNAVFATMTGVTGSASEVATQFKGALTGLKKPSEEMWVALDKIGFASGEAAIETLGFHGTLTALTGAVGGSESEMTKLFGSTESWDLIAGLAGVQAEKFTSNLGQMEGATGTLTEALNEQEQGINKAGADFAKLRQSFVVTAQRLGDELVPAFGALLVIVQEKVVPAVSAIVSWFKELSPAAKKTILVVSAIAAMSGAVLMVVGQLAIWGSAVVALGVTLGGLATAAAVLTGGIVALGLVIAGVKLFKWVQETQLLERAWISLKNTLGFLTDEQAEAERAALALKENLGDITPTAETLREALGGAGVQGSVKDLHVAMANLGGVVGGLSRDEMVTIAQRAIELREANKTLTPELENVVRWFEREESEAAGAAAAVLKQEEAARKAAEAARIAAEQIEVQAEAAKKLKDDTESLRAELAGDGLLRDLELLESAWKDLTPEQRENRHVMERAERAAVSLAEQGIMPLDDDLRGLVEAHQEAQKETKKIEVELTDLEQKAISLAKELSGENLRFEVEALAAGFELATEKGELSEYQFQELGRKASELKRKGGQLTPELRNVAYAFEEAEIAANATKLEVEETVGVFGSMKNAAKGLVEGLTGGQGLTGFFSGIGTGIVEGIGNIISGGIQALVNEGVKIVGKGMVAVGKLVAGLFGRDTRQNLKLTAERMWGIVLTDTAARAAEEMAIKVGDDFAGLLMSLKTVIDEAGGVMAVGFGKVAGAARDTFAAMEQGKLDADEALRGLLPVLGDLALTFDQAGLEGQEAFFELIRLADEFGLNMNRIIEVVGEDLVNQALGTDLPGVLTTIQEGLDDVTVEGLGPLLDTLIHLGVITDEQKTRFMLMAGATKLDTKAMEAAAERYGIQLSDLGPAFQEARISERAAQIKTDFDLLIASGMSMEDVILAQGPAIHAMVRDARWAGTKIPADMKPIIGHMIEQGRLVDENGLKIEDLSEIDFAKPMSEQLVDVMGEIRNLIQTFIDTLTPIGDVVTAVDQIPDSVDVAVNVDVPTIPPIKIDWDVNDPTRAEHWPGSEHEMGLSFRGSGGDSGTRMGAEKKLDEISYRIGQLVTQGREAPRKMAQQLTQKFREEGAFN